MLISRPISSVHGTRNLVERNAVLTYTDSIVRLFAFTPVPCKFRSLINNEQPYQTQTNQAFAIKLSFSLNSMREDTFQFLTEDINYYTITKDIIKLSTSLFWNFHIVIYFNRNIIHEE